MSSAGSIPACAGEPAGRRRQDVGPRVYPRVCGGTPTPAVSPPAAEGLSPRVRGNRCYGCFAGEQAGSIPACAGEPCGIRPTVGASRVYPRVCGGTPRAPHERAAAAGLSPRVRGNRGERLQRRRELGSIPACAGEPQCPSRHRGRARVYPRVCGGTNSFGSRPMRAAGLSPRVRGNRCWPAASSARARSIPACAGEPKGRGTAPTAKRVYPRVCGGTRLSRPLAEFDEGLSPRVRGNRGRNGRPHQWIGSIPACAGEPCRGRAPRSAPPVYPRVCGGTANRDARVLSALGLSPRVRGNPCAPRAAAASRGSIPACAGEPLASSGISTSARVYPRVCGGTRNSTHASASTWGLSPRVRGNPE